MTDVLPIFCEIFATRVAQAAALAEIATACARDVGQPLRVKEIALGARVAEPTLTLHLPAALAAGQTPAWCLACRLACFCPDARVSVLVHGAGFSEAGPLRRAASA